MNTSILFVAGITGTVVMTLCSVLISLIIKRPYYVVRTLARMLEFRNPTPLESKPTFYLLATLVHYGIGVGFCYFYFLLISPGFLGMGITHALLYGMLIGTIAIVGWRIFFAMHPSPPHYSLPIYLSMIWIGHIALAVTMFQVFQVFGVAEPISNVISTCKG